MKGHFFSEIHTPQCEHNNMCTCIRTYVCAVRTCAFIRKYICTYQDLHTITPELPPKYLIIPLCTPHPQSALSTFSVTVCLCGHVCVCVCRPPGVSRGGSRTGPPLQPLVTTVTGRPGAPRRPVLRPWRPAATHPRDFRHGSGQSTLMTVSWSTKQDPGYCLGPALRPYGQGYQRRSVCVCVCVCVRARVCNNVPYALDVAVPLDPATPTLLWV